MKGSIKVMPPENSEDRRLKIKRGLSLRTKGLLFVALLNIISTSILSAYFYHAQKYSIMKDIDDRLLASAHAIRYILPEGYHGRIISKTSISPDEYASNINKLSQFSKYAGVTYLYTMMESGNKIVFTSTSATNEELKKGAFDHFFTVYEDATPKLKQALRDHKVFFEESHDKYGDFRSVFVPVRMPSEKVYVMAADLDIRSIKVLLNQGLLRSLMIGGLLFILSMVVSVVFFRRFTGFFITGDILSGVTASSGKIIKASQDIVSNSAELASYAQDQNEVVSETSKTLEDLALVVGRSTEGSESVETELKSFNDTICARIGLINEMNDSMREIAVSSVRIEKIIEIMNEIAFQTNLLALNASVEADRAGDAGKGFSVVAEELRNFARMTAESSQDIEQLVHKNVDATRKGLDLVTETSDFFQVITEHITVIVAKISDITRVSLEQSAGMEYINAAIARTKDILEHNTDLAGMLSESSRELQSSVVSLEESIVSLKDK